MKKLVSSQILKNVIPGVVSVNNPILSHFVQKDYSCGLDDEENFKCYTKENSGDWFKMIEGSLREGSFKKEEEWFVMYDIDQLKESLNELKTEFGEEEKKNNTTKFIHCLAVKACPLRPVMKIFAEEGFGFECASWEEVALSLTFKDVPREYIVYDSPCKSRKNLRDALKEGVFINVDSIDELDRIKKILDEDGFKTNSTIGVRLNPEISEGKYAITSTATTKSKFGILISQINNEEMIKKFQTDYNFINGFHVHVGSAGMDVTQCVDGVKKIVEFITEKLGIDDLSKITLDVGGGLPIRVNAAGKKASSYRQYWELLKNEIKIKENNKEVSAIPKFKAIVTEFGRRTIAESGYVCSRVEYVKETPEKQIPIIHFGADIFARQAYSKQKMQTLHEAIFDENGSMLERYDDPEEKKTLDVGGPLCFSGDLVTQDSKLCKDLKEGCWVVVPMTGAYSYSTWSKYCSRCPPNLYFVEKNQDQKNGENEYIWTLKKKGQTTQESIDFWKGIDEDI